MARIFSVRLPPTGRLGLAANVATFLKVKFYAIHLCRLRVGPLISLSRTFLNYTLIKDTVLLVGSWGSI